ncbi:hypothetical protein HAX54_048616 [Datura stramonium]|uniref:Putative plant transposon protein domain-containing protein n=1 Tax=Datura stramonium TaxID=4076 RepID=A0ABS8SU38_DATST|nr:hypothetical protein [Datura stramonium]
MKSTLTFVKKFWWAVVRLRLLPTGEDNTLSKDRVVLVVSLVSGFPLNIGAIIIEEMNCRVVKLSTSLPFPCLITRLCREAYVPILTGIDVETYVTKNQNARAMETSTEPAGVATEGKLVYQVSPIHTFTPSTSSAANTQSEGESDETSSAMSRSSQYAFTLVNFSRVVRKADRQDKQLKLFVEQLGPFVDRAITTALEPYKHLHARMDEMEARERQPLEFSLANFEESEDESPFIVLSGEQPKATEKHLRNDIRDDGKTHKKKKHKHRKHEKDKLKEALKQSRVEEEMQARVGGASSSSAPQAYADNQSLIVQIGAK